MPKMMTITKAAAETGMTYHAIRQLILTGRFTGYIKIGVKTMINMDQFEDFLNGGTKNEVC